MSLTRDLASLGLLKFGEFKLTSGLVSRVYVDLRPLPSHPETFERVVRNLAREIRAGGHDAVCGVAVSGLPLAAAVAVTLRLPLLYVRKERKEHGTRSLREGLLRPGWDVAVLDDVATTGGSLERAISVLREAGAVVRRAYVIVDREQGASERLEGLGVTLVSLLRLPDAVEALIECGTLGKSEL